VALQKGNEILDLYLDSNRSASGRDEALSAGTVRERL
jgi:hypothetical protein